MPEEQPTSRSPLLTSLLSVVVFAWDFIKIIIVALAIILPIRYFIFQPFVVSGASMEPSFFNGQYLIIDEISYRFNPPLRGDVVVIRFPRDPKQFFIKRIVGLPGEEIEVDNGRLRIVNNEHPGGLILEESYLSNQGLTFPHNSAIIGGKRTLRLSLDEYFVLGDNRLASSDSRDFGPLPVKDIVGKVFVRVLPLTTFGKFEAPEYSF